MGIFSNITGITGKLFTLGKAVFDATAVTASATVTLPNKSGTMAMLSDIPVIAESIDFGTVDAPSMLNVDAGALIFKLDFGVLQ